MQLHMGGKDMGKQKASFNLKLNKNNKRELDQKLDKTDKSKVATKLAKQSANQKYKVQIKRQTAKLKVQKQIPREDWRQKELWEDRTRHWDNNITSSHLSG